MQRKVLGILHRKRNPDNKPSMHCEALRSQAAAVLRVAVAVAVTGVSALRVAAVTGMAVCMAMVLPGSRTLDDLAAPVRGPVPRNAPLAMSLFNLFLSRLMCVCVYVCMYVRTYVCMCVCVARARCGNT